MVLSQTAEYALRAMASLATVPDGRPARASDLSRATGIPSHYLSKILRRLVIADLLVSQKGQGGGFSLARPPEDIRFIDILVAVDGLPQQDRCAFGWGDCNDTHPCPLHESWSKLSDHLHAWARENTLAGLADAERAAEARPVG